MTPPPWRRRPRYAVRVHLQGVFHVAKPERGRLVEVPAVLRVVRLAVAAPVQEAGARPQVARERVVPFVPRLGGVAVSRRVERDVVVDRDVVRVVDEDAALVGVGDDVLGHQGRALSGFMDCTQARPQSQSR